MSNDTERWISSLPRQAQRLAITSTAEGTLTFLCMEIVTFTNLRERGAIVVQFIEDVWHRLLPQPLKLEATIWEAERSSAKPPQRLGMLPDSPAWQKTRERILNGRLETLHLADWDTLHSHQLRRGIKVRLGLHFGIQAMQFQGHLSNPFGPPDPREPRFVDLGLDTGLFGGGVPKELQQRLVQLAQALFVSLDGACGFIDAGYNDIDAYRMTDHERRIGMYGPNLWPLWRDVRGAFWGNLLSSYHVERLGGGAYVRDEAPTAQMLELPGSLYLQLSDSVIASDLTARANLAAFLKPILVSSESSTQYTILEPTLVTEVGGGQRVREAFQDTGVRLALLPGGAVVLASSSAPRPFVHASKALDWIRLYDTRGYRSIPQLRSLLASDDASVWTLRRRITPRPKSGPLFPRVLVAPYVLGNAIEVGVCFAEPASQMVIEQLKRLVAEWRQLRYEGETGVSAITRSTELEFRGSLWLWSADLSPVGQDSYFQLVLMLDEFSRSVARLSEVHIFPG